MWTVSVEDLVGVASNVPPTPVEIITWQYVALVAINAIQVIAIAYLASIVRKNGKDK